MVAAAALGLQLAGLACLAVAYVERDAGQAEGAYFNRAVGEDAVVLAWTSDVRPWLLAAGVLTVAATALWLRLALGARAPRELQRST